MLLSIANATPRNIEAVRVNELLPQGIQPSAKNFVDLIEHYYKYLNSEGLPSAEIGNIASLKDIDLVSAKYLDQIEGLIGKSIPNSRVLNRVELYKIIVRYYNTRGSQDSIHTFFKIFFDQLIQIVYPRERLFDLSGASGSWLGDKVIDEWGSIPYIRNVTDEITRSIGGIIYDAKSTNGSGQLISIEITYPDLNAYNSVLTYDNGLITITPGGKSHLVLSGSSLIVNSVVVANMPQHMYYSGIVNGRPAYSDRLNYVTPLVGTETRIHWDGTQWDFTIGSSTGDMYAYYSEDDVVDPIEVTTWLRGWGPIGAGSIDDIIASPVINAQIFEVLRRNQSVTDNVLLTTDAHAGAWIEACGVVPRIYLTSNNLPTNVDAGTIAVVNGMIKHPYALGIAAEFDGDIVWRQYVTDDWSYSDHKSFASDEYKIFDGYYWQNYSYAVRSDLDSSVWYDAYLKFVHPAGLKMFSAIVIEIVSRNQWAEPLEYISSDLLTDDRWMQALIPPHTLNASSIGFHTPKFQPGYLRDLVLRFIYMYLIEPGYDTALTRLVIMTTKYIAGGVAIDVRNSFVRSQYQISEKFIDTLEIGAGMLDKIIGEADEAFTATNSCRLLNLSMIYNSSSNNMFTPSFYDTALGSGYEDWDGSFFDESGGAGSGVWSNSSYENTPEITINNSNDNIS